LVAILNVIALAGAGLLGRLYVLATAEAVRLPNGEASPMPGPVIPGAAGAGDVPLTAAQIFDAWYSGRLKEDAAGRLSAKGAYEDYRSACAINSYPPMSQTAFGSMIGAKAAASGGRISRLKTGGNIVYVGLSFAGESAPLDVAAENVGYAPGLHRP
jgi:hypothetical protein